MPAWSGLWNHPTFGYNTNYSGLGVNTSELSNNEKMQLARGFRGRQGRIMGALIKALTGAVPGGTATSSVKQLSHTPAPGNPLTFGGVRTLATVNEINRATTAGDETLIDGLTTLKSAPTYPAAQVHGGTSWATQFGSLNANRSGGFVAS